MFSEHKSHKQQTSETMFQKSQTVIEADKLEGYCQLFMITEIQVYKDDKININESGLTTPLRLMDITSTMESITIDTHYEISAEPKLEYKITLDEKLNFINIPLDKVEDETLIPASISR